MSNKIFKAIWGVALVVFLALIILIMSMLYGYFTSLQSKQLEIETELAAQGVNLNGLSYFDGLQTDEYRITWINTDGSVIYDNESDAGTMENHLDREEVQEALADGYGESARYSATLSEKLLYTAIQLNDGTVIRLSTEQLTMWMVILSFIQPLAVIIFVVLGLSFYLAYRISKKIVEPINTMDLDNPLQYVDNEEYKEIEPLIRRIHSQQEQLKSNQKELEKTIKIRQEFTANVSHELKTPLQAISGYAELIENGLVREEDIKPFAGKIHKESLRLTSLVEDIIDLTKLDNGGAELKWQEADLYSIAQNAVDSLYPVADAKNISLSLQGVSSVVRGVPKTLYSIIYNLCDNAIKYNHEGGSVKVSVMDYPSTVKLIVADTGIGISSEDKERIFERFYRVDKSHSKEIGGTGLGLSIVKHGVQLHNAKISLESKPGEGSVFTVTFTK